MRASLRSRPGAVVRKRRVSGNLPQPGLFAKSEPGERPSDDAAIRASASGHVNTTATEPTKGRRRRRNHSAAFKAQVVASCRQTGVSIAAVAMANSVNANLLRRWIIDAEQRPDAVSQPVVEVAARAPSFVPMALPAPVAPEDIRIELRRGATAISVIWPSNAAADCAAWMRELLR